MSREKLGSIGRWVYMALAAFFLWWNLARMTEFSWTFTLMPHLGNIGCVAAVVILCCAWRKRTPLHHIMLLGLCWMAAMTLLRGENAWLAEVGSLKEGVIAFCVLAPLPGVLSKRRLRQFLKGVLALWVTAITCQAVIGLWAAFGGHAVFSMKGTWYIGMNLGDHRLYLNAYVTTAAAKLGMTVLLTAWLLILSRTRRAKIACGVSMVVQCAALSLTDCRTAFVALGVALGLGVWLLLRQSGRMRHALLVLPVLCLAGLVACYGVLTGFLTLTAPAIQPGPLDNLNLLELPAHMMPAASAEEITGWLDGEPEHRAIEAGNVFNGRQDIWKGVCRLLEADPKLLWTGTSAPLAAGLMNLYTDPGVMFYQHAHCLFLQVLVSWGIPGLLLLLTGIGYSGWHFVRLIRQKQPLWMVWMAVLVVYLLLCELVDCFTMLSTGSPMLYFLCLLMGAGEVLSRQQRKAA